MLEDKAAEENDSVDSKTLKANREEKLKDHKQNIEKLNKYAKNLV